VGEINEMEILNSFFTFRASYWSCIKELDTPERQLKYFYAICNFAFEGKETDFENDLEMKRMFILTKEQILRDFKRQKKGLPQWYINSNL